MTMEMLSAIANGLEGCCSNQYRCNINLIKLTSDRTNDHGDAECDRKWASGT
ncbi:hypothetical protein [Nostoc sp. ChiQUE01b]|uniref:hypothetical protein n=1 Tax=Nostoc sp. ChiQUE01b TaxID=3075376 RepID=UPI002AD3DBFD|nr:hypothetical protein [Nostoc sp. ChiQUE01b]MDZ8263730.1 hypothetical protein [Nostoc sp. ChiQUE01b]